LKNNNAPFKRINKNTNTDNLATSLTDIESKLFQQDIKGAIQKGYASTDGSMQGTDGSTNWFSYRVSVGETKTFTLKHDTISSFSVRLVTYGINKALIARTMVTEGDIVVPDNCTEFVINLPMPNGTPTPSSTSFANAKELNGLRIYPKGQDVVSKVDLLENAVLKIPTVDSYTKTTVPYTLITGYYNKDNGSLQTGTNWYATKIDANNASSVVLEHAESTTARIIYFHDNATLGSDVLTTNKKYPLPEGCTSVAFNFPLANSTPASTGLSAYTSTDRVKEMKLYFDIPKFKNITLSERLKGIDKAIVGGTAKTVKILSIGNSFSEDGQTMLYDIAKSAGIELVLGNLYMGGQSLQGHWDQVTGNLSNYVYQKRTATGRKDTANSSMKSGIIDEDWDIITFQQGSEQSGLYETYQPYLNNLITYVSGLATNANVKYAFHMTWAYASTSNHTGYDKYNNDQLTMYNGIVDATLKAMQETNISILIPNGTAVQNARTNSYLKAVGTEISRDGYHMDLGIGRYIVGLGYFQALLGGVYHKDVLADVTYVPTNNGATPFLGYLAKVAVRNANINPFKITAI
jgi:hypothetical protein